MKSHTSQEGIDQYLKLNAVSRSQVLEATNLTYIKVQERLDLEYQTKWAYYQHIDSLPKGSKWSCTIMHVLGDKKDGTGKPIKVLLEL